MTHLKLIVSVVIVGLSTVSYGQASSTETLTLERFLQLATIETEDFAAFDKSLGSLENEIAARDLELSTSLSLGASEQRDRKDLFTNFFGRDTRSRLLDVGLSKSFSTGTTLGLNAQLERAKIDLSANESHRTNWDVSLTQDLWRNGFGRSVRLRREGDQHELENRKLNVLLQKQVLLNELEGLYWDRVLLHRENVLRAENLKRSEQIMAWTQKRLRVSAARDTDLLQSRALLTSRRIEMANVERALISNRARVGQLIPSLMSRDWAPVEAEAEKDRALRSLVAVPTSDNFAPILIETLAVRERANELQKESELTGDSLNPTLQLRLDHGRNGIRPEFDDALDRALGTGSDLNRVSVLFSVNLERGLVQKGRRAAELEAEAAALRAQRLSRAGQLQWIDLEAQIGYLKTSLSLARELYTFQKKNIEAERRYFQQGRNTIFEFINYEIVAADAELRFFVVQNQLRKAESTARLFTVDPKAGPR